MEDKKDKPSPLGLLRTAVEEILAGNLDNATKRSASIPVCGFSFQLALGCPGKQTQPQLQLQFHSFPSQGRVLFHSPAARQPWPWPLEYWCQLLPLGPPQVHFQTK